MESKSLRIVYMGTPDFAVAPLRRLVESGYNVVAVVTMPDKPSGRGQKMTCSAVKEYALSVGLPIMQPERLKAPEFVESFKALDADLGIVVAFRMLPEVIWNAPRMGTFNLHASLLPDYRGAAPINWAVINGDTRSGVTTFLLNPEIDCGEILMRRECEILLSDNAGTLHDKLMAIGTDLVAETVDAMAAGAVSPVPQNVSTECRPAPKIFKQDCRIDWSKPAEAIQNLVRGLSPYPAAWTEIERPEGALQLKIYSTHTEICDHGKEIGEFMSDGKSYLRVVCPDGYVYIDELQAAGKRRMPVADFLRGFKL